ncbi:soluble lamin-associated protein of 75 kDa [Hypanus sabinus]|uniref:soluble lamin-associated protein of 75 kDa n=1 Tax=Hypanus sabinus TaxID=79690 RepID=UPI0028C4D811|nr:soluble lamin-associated protein of 75 kDa [Hypanus sabinus]XP_059830526.1 soluble lamin-associated protein of 75 kDa [Hypanus sabinus]
MAFPVDLLAELEHEDLEISAEEYMTSLLYGDPDKLEYFTLPNRRKIPISLSSVAFVPLYGGETIHKILALFAPESQFTAVALYLLDRWWAIDDIIKTTESSRQGLQQVTSVGERIVLYILNRIIYRAQEMNADELPFLCHGANEYAKILWKSGKAIGFYSIKPTGSKCHTFLTQCYQLPVLDTIFVRKKHRGKGYGLQMLEDFVDCFTEDALGLRYPLSPSMYRVCRKYLNSYPDDHNLLWEVEGIGHLFQRARIADRLLAQLSPVKGMDISQDEECEIAGESSSLVQPESENRKKPFGQVKKQPSTELLANQELPGVSSVLSEESTSTPIAKRGRSSQSKQPKAEKKHIAVEQKCSTHEEVIMPKDQLNSFEAMSDQNEEVLQTTGNQETCTISQDSIETAASDVVLCHIEVLEPDGDEDKESSSETPPELVNDDSVNQESLKPEEVTLSKSSNSEGTHLESAEIEEEISPKSSDSNESLPQQTMDAEQEISLKLPNSEEVVPNESSETQEKIVQETSKIEDEIILDSVKTEKEIAEDPIKDKEGFIEESTNLGNETTVNESANGAPDDLSENDPEEPKSAVELKECSEDNRLEKDEDIPIQNDSEESEPAQDPAANCSPSNHNDTDPNDVTFPTSTEQHDAHAPDNGHESVHEEASQHSGTEGESTSGLTKTTSAQQEGEPEESSVPVDLTLGPLLVIELEDVSLKQATPAHPSTDETKETDLKDQSSPAVAEKGVDSSSEEMEMEVPVMDRRNLRRKVKGNKGPPKKRSKVRHIRASTRT